MCVIDGVPFYPSTSPNGVGREGGMLKHAYESLPQHSSQRSLASFRQACGLVAAKLTLWLGFVLCVFVRCV